MIQSATLSFHNASGATQTPASASAAGDGGGGGGVTAAGDVGVRRGMSACGGWWRWRDALRMHVYL